jgi:adenosylhomocysteine nucleosidase
MSDLEIKSCDVGIIFALGIEAGDTEDLLSGAVRIRGQKYDAREGGIKGRRVVVVRSGAGRENSGKATELLIDGHRPELVISAGFGGGLSPKLKRHDIVLAEEIIDGRGGRIAVSLPDKMCERLEKLGVKRVGRFLTFDQVVRSPEDKQRLFDKHQAGAMDMETFAVAEVCQRRGTAFLPVRVILDAAGDSLPSYVERLLNQKTEPARWGAAMALLFHRPSSIKELWAMKENSLEAAGCIAKFIEQLLEK